MICEEVKQQIDDESGTGNAMIKSYLTRSEENQFFYNSDELRMWHKAGVKAKKSIPGHDYFSKIASYCKDHIDVWRVVPGISLGELQRYYWKAM